MLLGLFVITTKKQNKKQYKMSCEQHFTRACLLLFFFYNLDSEYNQRKKKYALVACTKNQAFFRFWLAGGRALGPGAFLAGGPWALGPRPLALGPWDLGPGPQALGTWALVLWALGPCARSARSLALRAASTPRGCLYSARQPLLNEAASSQRGSAVPEGCTLKMF